MVQWASARIDRIKVRYLLQTLRAPQPRWRGHTKPTQFGSGAPKKIYSRRNPLGHSPPLATRRLYHSDVRADDGTGTNSPAGMPRLNKKRKDKGVILRVKIRVNNNGISPR
jgi:hypothetical protein